MRPGSVVGFCGGGLLVLGAWEHDAIAVALGVLFLFLKRHVINGAR